MKKILFLYFLLLLGVPTIHAQDLTENVTDTNKIEGIGIFKIGKTRKEIIPLAEQKLKNKTIIINSSEFDSDIRNDIAPKVIAILKPNPDVKYDYPYNYSFCPNVKVYYIKTYEISGIKLKNIYLKFYNDTLIDFKCNGDEIISLALKKIYGNPEVIKESENTNCALEYLDRGVSKLNEITYENWYNNDIICSNYSSHYFDASCVLRNNKYIYVYSAKYKQVLTDCENNNAPKMTNKKTEKKLKNLSEF